MDATAGRLDALRALQGAFVRAIRAGDWTLAGDLQQQRFTLIDELLGGAPVTSPVVQELRGIVAADRALVIDLEAARDGCARQLQELRQARRAASAYAQGAPAGRARAAR